MPEQPLQPATVRALQHRVAVAQRDGRTPSVVAAVSRADGPVWFGAAGRVGDAVPRDDTQYRIGSITKTMVAVCVLRLVEQGVVALPDAIGTHLPDCPAPDATVFELLSHTAGLASETPPPWWERTDSAGRQQLTDILTAEPRRHPRGQLHHYSNAGYGLLGALVTTVGGRPWFDQLSEHVLGPLGMTRTSYLPVAPHTDGFAVHPWADVLLPEPAHDHGLLAAAGQLWSTPADLCRFGTFLAGDGGTILDRDTMELMRRPVAAPEPDWSATYALGVQHLRVRDRTLIGHTGSMPGFLAAVLHSEKDGLCAAVQTNAWSSVATVTLAADLIAAVAEREPAMPEPWQPVTDPDQAAFALVGPWYWGAVALTVRLDGRDGLVLARTGRPGTDVRFAPAGPDRWRGLSDYYDGEFLTVQRDGHGETTHLDLGSFVLTRQPYEPADVVPGGLDLGGWLLGP